MGVITESPASRGFLLPASPGEGLSTRPGQGSETASYHRCEIGFYASLSDFGGDVLDSPLQAKTAGPFVPPCVYRKGEKYAGKNCDDFCSKALPLNVLRRFHK